MWRLVIHLTIAIGRLLDGCRRLFCSWFRNRNWKFVISNQSGVLMARLYCKSNGVHVDGWKRCIFDFKNGYNVFILRTMERHSLSEAKMRFSSLHERNRHLQGLRLPSHYVSSIIQPILYAEWSAPTEYCKLGRGGARTGGEHLLAMNVFNDFSFSSSISTFYGSLLCISLLRRLLIPMKSERMRL